MSLPDLLEFKCEKDEQVMSLGNSRIIFLNDAIMKWLLKHSKHGKVNLEKRANYGWEHELDY